jgi:hypothetical protein
MLRSLLGITLISVLGSAVAANAQSYPPPSPNQRSLIDRMAPRGGWFPDQGGLFCWMPRCKFPNCWGPDTYCRKPAPQVCWPPYTPDYSFGRQGQTWSQGAW